MPADYRAPDQPVFCLYCAHHLGKKGRSLTPEHLLSCVANPKEARGAIKEALHQAVKDWEPDWAPPRPSVSDASLKQAFNLTRSLQYKVLQSGKLAILTPRGWLGCLFASHLDKIALQYVLHCSASKVATLSSSFMEALTQMLFSASCSCFKDGRPRGSASCSKDSDWTPGPSSHLLGSRLIDAEAMWHGTLLQKSPVLSHLVSFSNQDRGWGSMHPSSASQGNYFYSPPLGQQVKAIRMAGAHRSSGTIAMTLGFVQLSPEVSIAIRDSGLALVATIPPRLFALFPSPCRLSHRRMSTSPFATGIILGVADAARSTTKLPLMSQILSHWVSTFSPKAEIHLPSLQVAITGRSVSLAESSLAWKSTVRSAWAWLSSPLGNQGFAPSDQAMKVLALKGSKKYNALIHALPARLFRSFAADWEARMALVPPSAKAWWAHRSGDDPSAPPPPPPPPPALPAQNLLDACHILLGSPPPAPALPAPARALPLPLMHPGPSPPAMALSVLAASHTGPLAVASRLLADPLPPPAARPSDPG